MAIMKKPTAKGSMASMGTRVTRTKPVAKAGNMARPAGMGIGLGRKMATRGSVRAKTPMRRMMGRSK